MIKTIAKGDYRLIISSDNSKILFLGDQAYHWANAKGIGELLTFSKHEHKIQYILAEGKYKIFKVKDEPKLVDLEHLELSLGKGNWQGYLLLTGLPNKDKIRSRIIASKELISKK